VFQKANNYLALEQQQVVLNPMKDKDHVTSQLQQLYKNGSKATGESNNEVQTADGDPAGTGNFTSIKS
jgi:hypothetical protein